MRIAVSTDARTGLVDALLRTLEERGHEVEYFGPTERGGEQDWPLVTSEAANAVASGRCQEGIVCCWTGTGASIAANKVRGVRAALCGDAETARGARKWNHANVLALSLRLTTTGLLQEILDAWFQEPWTTDAWNTTQIERIHALDGERSP